jgi:Ala-tRNA(Pro) deacylase
MDKKLKCFLKDNNISYIEHEHPAVFTVEDSKLIKKDIPVMHTKSLFLKDEKENYYLFCIDAFKRLDMKKIKCNFNLKKLTFGSPEELKKELNTTYGSVSIFAMIYAKNINLIIDKDIWIAKSSGFHPNINTSTLEIDNKNLKKYLNLLNCKFEIMDL